MTRACAPCCLLLALGALASADPGEHLPRQAVQYYLAGQDDARGAFEGWLIVKPILGTDEVEVVRRVQLPRGEWELHRGFAVPKDDVLEVTLRADRGLVDVVRQTAWSPERATTIRFSAAGIETRGRSSAGNSQGRGHLLGTVAKTALAPVDPPDPELDGSFKDKVRGLKGHLLAIAQRELDGVAVDGVALDQWFHLGRFFHVGVGAGLHLLDPRQTTSEQRLVLDRHPRHVWIVSRIEGGVRIPLSASIPVGGVNVGVGFQPGAQVTYDVTDVYPIPEGWDQEQVLGELKQLGTRAYELPLSAADARAMHVGAQRVLDGQASVAVSGNLSIGREVAELGDVVRIGASARVGGFYRLSGRLRFEVQRLLDDQVRVRVTRGVARQPGVNMGLFVGASVDETALRELAEPGLAYFDEALIDPLSQLAKDTAVSEASKQVRRLLRIDLSANGSKVHDEELALSFRFDLDRPEAAAAYERAVRGDLRTADALATDPNRTGVVREFRVLDAEEQTHLSANLSLSVLLEAGASRSVSLADLDVDDESGRTEYEIFRYNRQRRFSVLGLSKRQRSVLVEVVRRTRPDGTAPLSRSLRFVFHATRPNTLKRVAEQLKRLMASWGLDEGAGLPEPSFIPFRTRYRKTTTTIDVGIAEAGIDQVLGAGAARALAAYAEAYEVLDGEVPLWATAEGRAELERTRHESNRDPSHDQADRDYDRAQAFVAALEGMGQAPTADERAEHMRSLAQSARYDLYTIAALVELAPREAVSLNVVMEGRRIRLRDGHLGERFAYTAVEDPRLR